MTFSVAFFRQRMEVQKSKEKSFCTIKTIYKVEFEIVNETLMSFISSEFEEMW